MKFNELINWANDRACDGCWGMYEAAYITAIIYNIRSKHSIFTRNYAWKHCEAYDKILAMIAELDEKRRMIHD